MNQVDQCELIRLDCVCKRFGGVTALDEVNLSIRRGEVHALVGQNGAGKSTLMKLLAGVHTADSGDIYLDGELARIVSPRDARDRGVSIVFQELNLLPQRSVAANIFANAEWANRWGLIRRREMNAAARRVLQSVGLEIDPDTLVGELSLGAQQLVEIARALAQQARIIILDEPNSALSEAESQQLFGLVRELRSRGTTVLYVSHRLDEVFDLADRITVIRDGRNRGTFDTARTSIPQIVAEMIGRPLEQAFPEKIELRRASQTVFNSQGQAAGPSAKGFASHRPAGFASHSLRGEQPILQVNDLFAGAKKQIGPVSFGIAPGEILGFAGLEGSGVDEVFRALFGLELASGIVQWKGDTIRVGEPLDAIRRRWALVPASRRRQGLFVEWSIVRNIAMAVLDDARAPWGFIRGSAVQRLAQNFIESMSITAANSGAIADRLSGGNQQKVLLAKWLAVQPELLILNDPTRGVDVGAKHEIYLLIRRLAAEGVAILLASSEADELIHLADRLLVFRGGQAPKELARSDWSKAQLMHAISAALPG
jgi:ribose transport system ATP-binding protein